MTANADSPEMSPLGGTTRPWPRAFALAAAALWVPPLLPLALTDVLEHGHCLRLYLRLYPVLAGVLPGALARNASGLEGTARDVQFVVVAAAVALGAAALAMGTVSVLRA